MSSPLTALVDIISTGVASIESTYKNQGLCVPALDEPFSPGPLNHDNALQMTIKIVVAAYLQLIATIRAPAETLEDVAAGMYMSATLGTGMSVQDISGEVGIDGGLLARVLRFLATRHVFREVKPNVFAHNRISSLLVKASSLSEIRKNPVSQYDGSPTAALVGFYTDEAFKSSTYISAYLLGEHKHTATPFNIAMDTKATIWEFYQQPENATRAHRMGLAIKGMGARFDPSIYFNALDLENGAVVVDVGGGVGAVTFGIAQGISSLAIYYSRPRFGDW
ncbi:hypothetical protein L218DRAFT_1076549 [Marasmius fiardii PR-910]|nr:hypothetical protein L218DRAFT_1076549 [Marasmius fiardii PR-910]